MKARRAAKIIKRDWNTDRLHSKEWAYLLRVTRRWYLNLARKALSKGDHLSYKYYVHKACDPFIGEDVIEMWNMGGNEQCITLE